MTFKQARADALVFLTLVAFTLILGTTTAGGEAGPIGLDRWGFVIGEWNLVEARYGFDGVLIQTNMGRASFSHVMDGQRIQELQDLPRGEQEMTALHLFAYNPRSDQLEIARTDSGHYTFSVLVGTMTATHIQLLEKHPTPDADVLRRVTYQRIDSNHFTRQLEFSTDNGESWFVRSKWEYKRI